MNGGRPEKVHGIMSWTQDEAPEFPDNTLGVLEYSNGGIGMIDLSAREMGGHRRFEVFGTKGTAIILESFADRRVINLTLDGDRGGYKEGDQVVEFDDGPEWKIFDKSAAAFAATCAGEAPTRPLDHEVLVLETLLRVVGAPGTAKM